MPFEATFLENATHRASLRDYYGVETPDSCTIDELLRFIRADDTARAEIKERWMKSASLSKLSTQTSRSSEISDSEFSS
jgi:hypothetical protein